VSANTIEYKKNLSADTSRGPSPNIWADCPWEDLVENPGLGVTFFDDFMNFPITPPTTEGNWGPYAVFTDTGGTVANVAEQGGAVAFGSDGDNEGASIRTVASPFKISQTTGKFWFEARVKSSTIADTKHGIFLGLMESTPLTAIVPITAAGALADKNLVGFLRNEGDGDMFDTVYKADGVTAVTVQADAVTLVADTYVKIGMVYEQRNDPQTGFSYVLSFYANNLKLASYKRIPSAAGTDFPNDITMGPVFAVLNATASTPGTSTIDWWRGAQLLF
jgi:hypothetical protein